MCDTTLGSVSGALPCLGRILHEKAWMAAIQALTMLRLKYNLGVYIISSLISHLAKNDFMCGLCLYTALNVCGGAFSMMDGAEMFVLGRKCRQLF